MGYNYRVYALNTLFREKPLPQLAKSGTLFKEDQVRFFANDEVPKKTGEVKNPDAGHAIELLMKTITNKSSFFYCSERVSVLFKDLTESLYKILIDEYRHMHCSSLRLNNKKAEDLSGLLSFDAHAYMLMYEACEYYVCGDTKPMAALSDYRRAVAMQNVFISQTIHDWVNVIKRLEIGAMHGSPPIVMSEYKGDYTINSVNKKAFKAAFVNIETGDISHQHMLLDTMAMMGLTSQSCIDSRQHFLDRVGLLRVLIDMLPQVAAAIKKADT